MYAPAVAALAKKVYDAEKEESAGTAPPTKKEGGRKRKTRVIAEPVEKAAEAEKKKAPKVTPLTALLTPDEPSMSVEEFDMLIKAAQTLAEPKAPLTPEEAMSELTAEEEELVNDAFKEDFLTPIKQPDESMPPPLVIKKLKRIRPTLVPMTMPPDNICKQNHNAVPLKVFQSTSSVFLCQACSDESQNHTVLELPNKKLVITFVICEKCRKVNQQVNDTIDAAIRGSL